MFSRFKVIKDVCCIITTYHQADNWETLAESCMLLFRSSRHWKDHQHLVFGPRSAGNLDEGRRAGAERLQRQVRRRSGRPLVVWWTGSWLSFLSAGASTWWGTRSRCLLSRRSHCPKDGTRSSFWTKPTGKQAVQWLFKNKEIPILRLKLQGNMKYEGAASRKICWQRPRRSCSHWAFVSWSPSLWKLQKTCFAPTKATERVKLQ